MQTLLLTLALGTVSAQASSAPPSSEPPVSLVSEEAPRSPKVAVWFQPVPLAVTKLYVGPPGGNGPLYLPLGATVALTPHVALGGELSVYDWRALLVSAGPVLSTHGPLSGLFVHPKLVLAQNWRSGGAGAAGTLPGPSAEVQLGLDVGVQFNLGPVYLAPVVGVGVGYCRNCSIKAPSQLLPPLGPPVSPQPHDRFVFGLNLNLLRAGFTL
jgi:hypothetical protein